MEATSLYHWLRNFLLTDNMLYLIKIIIEKYQKPKYILNSYNSKLTGRMVYSYQAPVKIDDELKYI